ncbi:MAG: type II toxin-antitoxin system RelE/ParE family toxin [Planctomycetota bacterium]
MTYRVIVTSAVERLILGQAAYIAIEQSDPERAEKWVQKVFNETEKLDEMPRRFQKATEDASRDYEVRRMRVGQYLLFFTIVEETKTVWVIHAKSTRQKTRPHDLPTDLEAFTRLGDQWKDQVNVEDDFDDPLPDNENPKK